MKVTVKLFAAARELVGQAEVTVEMAAGGDVAQLRRELAERTPPLASLASRSLIAVNAEYAGDATPIAAGDELALIPPVSGG
jgi:molybdopterin synthase catalytic subunit